MLPSLCKGGHGCGQPVYLCCGDDKHDDADEYREVTVGLARPVNHELAVLLPPLPGGEEQAVALEVVLVHRHGDGDAEREDGRDAVPRQLDVEDEVGGLRHSGLGMGRLQSKVSPCNYCCHTFTFSVEL